jgi:hypothetical protein
VPSAFAGGGCEGTNNTGSRADVDVSKEQIVQAWQSMARAETGDSVQKTGRPRAPGFKTWTNMVATLWPEHALRQGRGRVGIDELAKRDQLRERLTVMGATFSEDSTVRAGKGRVEAKLSRCIWDGVVQEDDADGEDDAGGEDDANWDVEEEADHFDVFLAELQAVAESLREEPEDVNMIPDELDDEEGIDNEPTTSRESRWTGFSEMMEEYIKELADIAQEDLSPLLFSDDPENLTYNDYVHHMLSMKCISSMGDKMFEMHAKTMAMLLGKAGGSMDKLPATVNRMKAQLNVKDVWSMVRHFCPKFHKLYDDTPSKEWDAEEECGCEYVEDGIVKICKEKRFHARALKHGVVLVPREWMVYLGVKRTLQRWMGDGEFWEQRAQREARDPENGDIWGGHHVKRMDSKVGGALLDEEATLKAERIVYRRTGCMIEAGYDHYPVWGKDGKRCAHRNTLHTWKASKIVV